MDLRFIAQALDVAVGRDIEVVKKKVVHLEHGKKNQTLSIVSPIWAACYPVSYKDGIQQQQG